MWLFAVIGVAGFPCLESPTRCKNQEAAIKAALAHLEATGYLLEEPNNLLADDIANELRTEGQYDYYDGAMNYTIAIAKMDHD